MAGFRDILLAVPPVLLAGWAIATPATALADCRIAESHDPTYGTFGWVPRLDDRPFAILSGAERRYSYPQTWSRNVSAALRICLAVGHAEAPAQPAAMDYNDRVQQWLDALEDVLDANRRLNNATLQERGVGSIIWTLTGPATPFERKIIYGVPYYGAEIVTDVAYIKPASYAP